MGVTAAADLAKQQWHHLAATYDGQEMALFLDGAPIGAETVGEVQIGNDAPLLLSSDSRLVEIGPGPFGGLRQSATACWDPEQGTGSKSSPAPSGDCDSCYQVGFG